MYCWLIFCVFNCFSVAVSVEANYELLCKMMNAEKPRLFINGLETDVNYFFCWNTSEDYYVIPEILI